MTPPLLASVSMQDLDLDSRLQRQPRRPPLQQLPSRGLLQGDADGLQGLTKTTPQGRLAVRRKPSLPALSRHVSLQKFPEADFCPTSRSQALHPFSLPSARIPTTSISVPT